jgi:hypothetical protein
MANTNLPISLFADSGASTRLFFDTYGVDQLEFNAVDIDAAVGFFTSRGFDKDAALVTASTVLNQAKSEGIPVFQLLDTIKNLDEIQLTAVIAQVLNNNRVPTSFVGYRDKIQVPANIARNIRP